MGTLTTVLESANAPLSLSTGVVVKCLPGAGYKSFKKYFSNPLTNPKKGYILKTWITKQGARENELSN